MKAYKYRSNDEKFLERDIATFSQNKFYASTFEDLNDPFEANFNESITESVAMLETMFSINAKDMIQGFNDILKFKDKLGILSLSKSVLSEQMWAHYSNSNYGYCIEYDLDKITERSQNYDLAFNFDISYKDILPLITIEDIRSNNMAKKMFGNKKEFWSYEKETRIVFDSSSLKEHHESAITGIYFGYKTDTLLIEKFKDKFRNRDITFYQMKPNRKSNFLEYEELFKFNRLLKFNLKKFNFEVIKLKLNSGVNNYYIYLPNNYTKAEMKELCMAFIEKFSYKPSNIYLLNSKSNKTIELIDKYPKSTEEYIYWAETVIADFPFDCGQEIFTFPLKDSFYNSLKK